MDKGKMEKYAAEFTEDIARVLIAKIAITREREVFAGAIKALSDLLTITASRLVGAEREHDAVELVSLAIAGSFGSVRELRKELK